jgi:hypothetical protein
MDLAKKSPEEYIELHEIADEENGKPCLPDEEVFVNETKETLKKKPVKYRRYRMEAAMTSTCVVGSLVCFALFCLLFVPQPMGIFPTIFSLNNHNNLIYDDVIIYNQSIFYENPFNLTVVGGHPLPDGQFFTYTVKNLNNHRYFGYALFNGSMWHNIHHLPLNMRHTAFYEFWFGYPTLSAGLSGDYVILGDHNHLFIYDAKKGVLVDHIGPIDNYHQKGMNILSDGNFAVTASNQHWFIFNDNVTKVHKLPDLWRESRYYDTPQVVASFSSGFGAVSRCVMGSIYEKGVCQVSVMDFNTSKSWVVGHVAPEPNGMIIAVDGPYLYVLKKSWQDKPEQWLERYNINNGWSVKDIYRFEQPIYFKMLKVWHDKVFIANDEHISAVLVLNHQNKTIDFQYTIPHVISSINSEGKALTMDSKVIDIL